MGLYRFRHGIAVVACVLAGCPALAGNSAVEGCKSSDRYHHPAAAYEICDRALQQKGLSKEDRAELLLGRGEAAYFVGRFDASAIDLDEALALNPNLNEAYLRRAWTRLRTFQHPGALQDITTLLSREPDNVDALFAIGFFYMHTSEWKTKAIPAYERVLELNPNHYLTRLNLASIYRDYKNDPDKAIAEYDIILRASDEELNKIKLWRDPGTPTLDFRGRARLDRIQALTRKGMESRAIAEADSLVGSYPDVAEVYVARAQINDSLRQFDKVLADAVFASKLEPNGEEQRSLEVKVLYQMHRYDEAIARADQLLGRPLSGRGTSNILFWRALTKKKMHLADEALKDFEESFRYDWWPLAAVLTQLIQSGYYDGKTSDSYNEKVRSGLQACILDPECAT